MESIVMGLYLHKSVYPGAEESSPWDSLTWEAQGLAITELTLLQSNGGFPKLGVPSKGFIGFLQGFYWDI